MGRLTDKEAQHSVSAPNLDGVLLMLRGWVPSIYAIAPVGTASKEVPKYIAVEGTHVVLCVDVAWLRGSLPTRAFDSQPAVDCISSLSAFNKPVQPHPLPFKESRIEADRFFARFKQAGAA